MHEPITVRWLGHACFKVEKGAYSVVLDPYAPGSVPGLPDIRTDANLVLCSHGHSDHGCAEAVALRPAQDCPFSVTKIETFHDACGGAQRGPNTIHVLEADGVRIAHFGDLGCALTDAQANALQGVDVALLPVGGFYTIDAAQAKAAADRIGAKVVVPMHYRTARFGLEPITTLDEFLRLCADPVLLDRDTFTVGEVRRGVVVPAGPV